MRRDKSPRNTRRDNHGRSRSPRSRSRSPTQRLQDQIASLDEEDEFSTSSSDDEEAARRQRLRAARARSSSRSRSPSRSPSPRRVGSPTPASERRRRLLLQYSDSSDSSDDTPRQRRRRARVSGGLARALDGDHWPEPGARDPGCLRCRFVWDPDGEFDRHRVERTVRDLMEGAAGTGGQRLSEKEAEEMLSELRYIAHMQRAGGLAMRRADLLDATAFAAGLCAEPAAARLLCPECDSS